MCLRLMSPFGACYGYTKMDAPGKVPVSINCHSCGAVLDLTGQTGFTHVECKHCGATSVVPLQFGNFLLLHAIGVGSTGTVYKAIDLPLSRYLAVKILLKKLSADPAFVRNFTREAQAVASVPHPNVVQVYSFDLQDGQYYLAMELCDHGSLDDRITKLGKLSEADVLSMGLQIASALHAAWRRGLLHRDVKPGNILFNEDDVPKIVDFGLARPHHPQTNEEHASDQIWGTPYYIAPEKLRGKPEDMRSDEYSLGATLYHALTGHPPTEMAPTERAPHVISRMMARDPAARYSSYDEIIHDLTEAQRALRKSMADSPAIPASPTTKKPSWFRFRWPRPRDQQK